jgi:hypothetical protein
MVSVRTGHWSRLPNREQLLGTNAGPGSSTNRDREVSTWARASEEGVDHWSRFVARTGIVDLCILGYFYTAARFCVFFSFIYLVCFIFNLMVLHIYSNNEETIYIYIYYTSWSRIYYSPSHPSCLVETYYKR